MGQTVIFLLSEKSIGLLWGFFELKFVCTPFQGFGLGWDRGSHKRALQACRHLSHLWFQG